MFLNKLHIKNYAFNNNKNMKKLSIYILLQNKIINLSKQKNSDTNNKYIFIIIKIINK